MSDRWEKGIKDWYANPNIIKLEYLNLEFLKAELRVTSEDCEFYCFHKFGVQHQLISQKPYINYLVDCVTLVNHNVQFQNQQRYLFSNICIKNFKTILENQSKILSQNQEILKHQTKLTQNIHQLAREFESHKPLTKTEVTRLVEQIAQQPKLVEAEALRLTENLNQKLQEVEKLLQEVKHVLTS